MTAENPNPNDPPADDTALGTAASQGDPAPGAPKPGDDPPAAKPDDPAPEPKADPENDPAPEGAPDEYDAAAFKLPEGVTFDQEGFEAVAPAFKDLNLTQEQAGKLVSTYAEKVVPLIEARTIKAIDDQGAQLKADLARKLHDDPEVGGKKLDESRSYAAKAIAHFIPSGEERSEFSTFLNESGLGNHPLLMRLVAGAGKAISEASTPAGEKSAAPASDTELFYGKRGN